MVYKWNFTVPRAEEIMRRIQERAQSGSCGRLVIADISNGAEQVRL